MIDIIGTKIWMDIYNKPILLIQTIRVFKSPSKLPQKYSILFLLDASELLLKKKNMKLNRCSELKTLKQQKYLIALIENSIERALEIPLNEVRKSKEKRTEEIIPILSTHNPNNPNISNHNSNI